MGSDGEGQEPRGALGAVRGGRPSAAPAGGSRAAARRAAGAGPPAGRSTRGTAQGGRLPSPGGNVLGTPHLDWTCLAPSTVVCGQRRNSRGVFFSPFSAHFVTSCLRLGKRACQGFWVGVFPAQLAVQRLGRQPNCSSQNKPPDSGFRHRGGRWPELHRPVLRGHGPVLGDLGLVQGRQGGLRRVLRPGVRPRKRLLGPPGGGCPPEGREWNRGVGCWPAASVGGGRGAAMRFRPEFAVGG